MICVGRGDARHHVANADELLERYHAHPCHLERLYGVVTDLYIDCCKAKVGYVKSVPVLYSHAAVSKGKNGRASIPKLIELLNDYSLASLSSAFQDI